MRQGISDNSSSPSLNESVDASTPHPCRALTHPLREKMIVTGIPTESVFAGRFDKEAQSANENGRLESERTQASHQRNSQK